MNDGFLINSRNQQILTLGVPVATHSITPFTYVQQQTCHPEGSLKYDVKLPESQKSNSRRCKKTEVLKEKVEPDSSLTLWDVVTRHRRKRRRETSNDQTNTNSEGDLRLNSLLSLPHIKESTSSIAVKEQTYTPNNDADNLFENTDPFLILNEAQENLLSLDAQGNLLLDVANNCQSLSAQDHFIQSCEGRDFVDEDYLEGGSVQPYPNAYKYTKAAVWSKEDEEKYFSGLASFGLDFTMIQLYLPHFTLKQLRDKYRSEERKHPGKIDMMLSSRRPIDIAEYEKIHGKIDVSKHFKYPSDNEDEEVIDDALTEISFENAYDKSIELTSGSSMVESLEKSFEEAFEKSFEETYVSPRDLFSPLS